MGKITGKPRELKKVNTSLILNSIRKRITATSRDISEDTRISHTTVSTILKKLISENEIVSIGLDESSGGRRAKRYKINSYKKLVIAVSIGKSKLFYRVVNILGEILESESLDLDGLEDSNTILKSIDSLVKKYPNVKCIGLSVPGIVTESGYISGRSFEEWKEIFIRKPIEKLYNIPVVLENDLNSIALGFYEGFKEKSNIAYLNFTTIGSGAGIVVNGEILRGVNGYAGEIGIIPMGISYLNDILFSDLNNEDYCNTIVNMIIIIASIINPKLVVLGGDYFRYDLGNLIIEKYNLKCKIPVNILLEDREKDYELLGITEIAFNLINDEVKLII